MTENVLLPTLLSEFCLLSQKLQQISTLIVTYGGILPALPSLDKGISHQPFAAQELPVQQKTTQPTITTGNAIEPYPLLGVWRQKIVYGLKYIGKPTTAKELAELVLKLESSNNTEYIDRSVAQYLSILTKKGIIYADKSEYPHRYSLIS